AQPLTVSCYGDSGTDVDRSVKAKAVRISVPRSPPDDERLLGPDPLLPLVEGKGDLLARGEGRSGHEGQQPAPTPVSRLHAPPDAPLPRRHRTHVARTRERVVPQGGVRPLHDQDAPHLRLAPGRGLPRSRAPRRLPTVRHGRPPSRSSSRRAWRTGTRGSE